MVHDAVVTKTRDEAKPEVARGFEPGRPPGAWMENHEEVGVDTRVAEDAHLRLVGADGVRDQLGQPAGADSGQSKMDRFEKCNVLSWHRGVPSPAVPRDVLGLPLS